MLVYDRGKSPGAAMLYEIPLTTIEGRATSLEAYRGRVLLIVNVASRCLFTPQYAGLEALYRRHVDAGLTVLGFPCDQFGHQEPASEAEIVSFCATRYAVSFPMFAKTQVNGPDAHTLFKVLKAAAPGWFGKQPIRWNFTKFLIDREGHVHSRHAPQTAPHRLESAVLKLLG